MSKSITERKEAWAQKMRERQASLAARTERSTDRLPPGQHESKNFPVLDLGIHPKVSDDEWRLEIGGLVENPMVLEWRDLEALPQIEDVSDFHCVTTWSAFGVRWGGARFRDLIDLVRPAEGARFVFYTAYDGYTTNTPLEVLMDDDVLLATKLGGKPLPVEHGGPARVVIPKLYAWKSAKFVRQIEFRAEDELGYWEKRGYSNSADPWLEERFA